jgi:hypothetical protein
MARSKGNFTLRFASPDGLGVNVESHFVAWSVLVGYPGVRADPKVHGLQLFGLQPHCSVQRTLNLKTARFSRSRGCFHTSKTPYVDVG